MRTQAEIYTEQFYGWERRGRGWDIWPKAVSLEPPFRPFVLRYAAPRSVYDDARKPTLLSSLTERFHALLSGLSRVSESGDDSLGQQEEPTPVEASPASDLCELSVLLPTDCVVDRERTEQFLLTLGFREPVSFEIVATDESIRIQFTCRNSDASAVQNQLRTFFPEAIVVPGSQWLENSWRKHGGTENLIVDFGLSQEFMLPLRTVKNFSTDPLTGILGSISGLGSGETAVIQVLFEPVRHPWADSIMRSVTDSNGDSFFADAPELPSLAKQKCSKPLYAAVIRVGCQANGENRVQEIVRRIASTFGQFSQPTCNELIPLTNEDYADDDHESDLLLRQSHRNGLLLNLDELISLVHLPSESVRLEKLVRQDIRSKAVPQIAIGHSVILGENTHNGTAVPVSLSPDQRTRHMHVIGASGTGKSTLLLSLILQDIQNGEGVGVLDPHGDLVDEVLRRLPESRSEDVIVFDPGDEAYPIGFNPLSAHSELEKNLISSDLVALFRRLSTSWGDQMTSVLSNAILAFLESDRGGTLLELRRFLVEQDFRKDFLSTVKDEQVVYYWQREFPLLAGRPQGSLLTRLDTFLRPKVIRNIVSQRNGSLDFDSVLNDKKVFLVKLAQGIIGEENSYVLGTLIVSKLHQMAMARQQVRESDRPNFYLYIDEFHNFVTPSMASILTAARKYHLALTLSHQEFRQLSGRDAEVASAVMSNPYTRVCFRLGDSDAQRLKDGFSFFDSTDLQNLGIGEAIVRIERADFDFNLRAFPVDPIDATVGDQRRESIIDLSRRKYAQARREEVRMQISSPVAVPVRPPVPNQVGEPVGKINTDAVKPHHVPAPIVKVPVIPETPQLGRGGAQHKYLQELIKRLAEDRGYRATIEQQILGGTGSVDVSLERDGQRIACEISVSSTEGQELGNVQKCIAAGYDLTIVLSTERKMLQRLEAYISKALGKDVKKAVLFLLPEELIGYLDEAGAAKASNEQIVRGYRVKVEYQPVTATERKDKHQAISRLITQAVRRSRVREEK